MKIGFIIWHYWPWREGGAERQCRLIANALSARGHRCTVFAARTRWGQASCQRDGGTTIRRYGALLPVWAFAHALMARLVDAGQVAPDSGDAKNAWRLEQRREKRLFWLQMPWMWLARADFMLCLMVRRRRLKRDCDILHLHEPSWLGGFADFLASSVGVGVLCQEATDPVLPVIGYDTPFRKTLQARRMKPMYAAMTQSMVAGLVTHGISKARVFLLNNAVRIPAERANVTKNSDVLYVGNLSQGAGWKAFDILIEAWARVSSQRPDARLVVVGGGSTRQWIDLAESLGCRDSITFTGRVLDPAEYYQNAAMLVLPSRVEGMSNAVLEAQSWGLPVVASDIPANAAVIRDGENGLLAAVGDSAALAERIVSLLDTPGLRAVMGQAARQLMETSFSPDSVLDTLLPLYDVVLSDESHST